MSQDTAQNDAKPSTATNLTTGLTTAEVNKRVADGKANVDADLKTKSIPTIFAQHICTLFNFVNAVLALLVFTTGSYRNLLFIWVVIANLVIGIFQEVRSKITVDKLSVLAEKPVRVRRDGKEIDIAIDQIVLDDIILLSHGDQVPADAVVVDGTSSMNESLLTGESNAIAKKVGDDLMSGSFVDSGSVVAQITKVGADSYAARINAQAKYVKRVHSEIMTTLKMIIRFATYLLLPLGLGLYWRSVSTGDAPTAATLTTVAALVGMIPQGLILLTSTVLAIATTRLANRKVLIQQLYCIETLARVDVLCLDKTGTITSGHMKVDRIVGADGKDLSGSNDVSQGFTTITTALSSDVNETARALIDYSQANKIQPLAFTSAVPFSSARKYSGCVTSEGHGLVMGAAQFVMGERFGEVEKTVRSFGEQARVLVVARCDGFGEDDTIKGTIELLGFIVISDIIRDSAPQTISFFHEQGVMLNVISGDDPATVSHIAASVGVPNADQWVDASTLTTPEMVAEAATKYHVFGRVTPEQKREFVIALKAAGHTVAMTGDGVNDVLALKEADCSVAMASGSDAARNVAEVVLVDNDFAHMPEVVAEGRRSINNLQRSASLFLVKTVFSAVLAAVCIINPPYPFLPVQMSLISAAIIGVPSFVLALEPNHDRVSGNFLGNVLARSMPASIVISVVVAITTLMNQLMGFDFVQISTLCTLITCSVGLALITRISIPFTPLRSALLTFCCCLVVAGATLGRSFFEMCAFTTPVVVYLVIAIVVSLVAFNFLFDRWTSKDSVNGWFQVKMRQLEEKNANK